MSSITISSHWPEREACYDAKSHDHRHDTLVRYHSSSTVWWKLWIGRGQHAACFISAGMTLLFEPMKGWKMEAEKEGSCFQSICFSNFSAILSKVKLFSPNEAWILATRIPSHVETATQMWDCYTDDSRHWAGEGQVLAYINHVPLSLEHLKWYESF